MAEKNKSRDAAKHAPPAPKMRDPDVRVGAKGVMQQDIGESICLQDGNDCR